jgi:hypothetical protein
VPAWQWIKTGRSPNRGLPCQVTWHAAWLMSSAVFDYWQPRPHESDQQSGGPGPGHFRLGMYKQQALAHSLNNYNANVCDLFGIEFEPLIIPPVECSESSKGGDHYGARLINRFSLKARHVLLEEVLATPPICVCVL